MSFEIITDSSANLTDQQIEQYRVGIISLSYLVDGKEYRGYTKTVPTDYAAFYNFAREKHLMTTSLPSYGECMKILEAAVKTGKDVLYIGFSSALSGTFQRVKLCLDEIKESNPNFNFYAVDSLCASMGEGLLVHYAVKLRDECKTIEEVSNWLENNKLRVCHWFTVDDLFYLKRGGRISTASAVAGSILSVKPVMHVDDEGRLVLVSKVRGRKKSLNALIDNMEQSLDSSMEQAVFISHGDCIDDARYVAEQVEKRFGYKDIVINYVDPVIGSHSGPGTVALFYMGEKR